MPSADREQFDKLLTNIVKAMTKDDQIAWAKRAVSPFLNKQVKASGSVGDVPATWQPELPQGRRKMTEVEKLAKKFGKLTATEQAQVRQMIVRDG